MARTGYQSHRARGLYAEGTIPFYRFVKKGTGDKQVLLCGAGEDAIGISVPDERMENADGSTRTGYIAGEKVAIQRTGIGVVEAGGAVTVGSQVKSDASGRAVASTDPTVGATYAQAEVQAVRDYWKVAKGAAISAAAQAGDFMEIDMERKP